MLQCGGQVGEQIRQAAAKGLSNEQRRPDDRDVEKKTKNKVVLLICLLQAVHLRENKKSGPSNEMSSAAGAAV